MTEPFDLWGQTGEYPYELDRGPDYLITIRRLLVDRLGPLWPHHCTQVITVAQLDPAGKHPAVVSTGGLYLGRLRPDDAKAYGEVLQRLRDQRKQAQVSARVSGHFDPNSGRSRIIGSINLDLAEPRLLVPANQAPKEPHVLLPPGAAIPVLVVNPLPERVAALVGPAGESWVYATLDEETDGSAAVEVRIGYDTCGYVPAPASDALLPAVRALARQGLKAAGRGLLSRDGSAMSLALHAARAHEFAEEPPTTVPAQREIEATFTIIDEEPILRPGRHRRDP